MTIFTLSQRCLTAVTSGSTFKVPEAGTVESDDLRLDKNSVNVSCYLLKIELDLDVNRSLSNKALSFRCCLPTIHIICSMLNYLGISLYMPHMCSLDSEVQCFGCDTSILET